MLVQALAAAALVLFLWSFFRYAMGLRASKLLREEERGAHEAAGWRVVAELPLDAGVVLFLESESGFRWADHELLKRDLRGARLLLNGAQVALAARAAAALPEAPTPDAEEHDGSERWAVRLYLADGGEKDVTCGRLREGVSRDAARQVFVALRLALAGEP